MSKYLLNTTEQYRVDTEPEVNKLIEEAKEGNLYNLIKYSSQHKEIKKGGEVYDEYYVVSLTKEFTNAKEPEAQVNIIYED